ncbi:glycosyltransferase family 4 protein [Neobacillus sp. NRS-1170]|uniref:glycosyltransferase family 4 protein n=1 Tax=Neobacillus sp. NRS-1170 TaxID=3233898 RepID=UPI003D2E596D
MSKRIVIFRPGIVANKSAFEAMLEIYRYLQNHFNWEFVIIKDEEDDFFDPDFMIVNIPKISWATFPRSPFPINFIMFQKKVLKNLKGFDWILSSDPTIYKQGLLAAYASKILNIPLIYDASLTVPGVKMGFIGKINNRISKWALKQAKIIWITVPKVAERFKEIGLFNNDTSQKFIVMGHPVNTTIFKPSEYSSEREEIVILCVSRFVVEKGIQYIISALKPLIKKHPNVKLKLVGGGEAKAFLERIIKENQLEENVEFIGNVPHKDLVNIYQNADIFINHPISVMEWEEFFGVSNIEAMSCGLPIVTSTCGGISYVLRENDIAEIVNERDIVGITNSLEKLINDRNYYNILRENGRKYVQENYDLKVIAEKYKKCIDEQT